MKNSQCLIGTFGKDILLKNLNDLYEWQLEYTYS